MFGQLIKFPGVDGHNLAVDKHHVLFLEGAAVAGEPVTNIHMTNGRWVTARGSLDEIAAVLCDTRAQDDEKRLEEHRAEARARRRARAEVDAVMRAVNYTPKCNEWGVETLPDGRRKVTAVIDPMPIPETGPCFNCGAEGGRLHFIHDAAQIDGAQITKDVPLYGGALWCGECQPDTGDLEPIQS